jgi:DNA uptake protein ComE-like DNA-binding protein
MRTRILLCSLFCGIILCFSACSPDQSPDQIRQKTAEDTATLKHDSKAVVEGIKEGLSDKKSVDLNKGSREDLESLPGMNHEKVNRIIAERPYNSGHQLVSRHVLSEDEYSQIQDRVIVSK